MVKNTFERLEVKYLLNREQYERIIDILPVYMNVDEYGLSTIQSIYYDTDSYDIIRTSLEKPVYKEKLRLRAYGEMLSDDSPVFLELKKKYKGVVYKRRIKLPLLEAEKFLYEGTYPKEDSQILREIDYFIKHYAPSQSTYIAYDRIAMYGKQDSDIRITFDKDIRVAFDQKSIRNCQNAKTIIAEGERLMEVKVSGSMPLWLTDIISKLRIYPYSFSKYGQACLKREMESGQNKVDLV